MSLEGPQANRGDFRYQRGPHSKDVVTVRGLGANNGAHRDRREGSRSVLNDSTGCLKDSARI